jgi:hypothetical protein
MQKKIITQEDLDLNPDLADQGVKVGDEIEIPETEQEQSDENLSDEDTGGSTPPPNKGRG